MKRRLAVGCAVLVIAVLAIRAGATGETRLARAAAWAQTHVEPWKTRFVVCAGQAWHRGEELAGGVYYQVTRGYAAARSRLVRTTRREPLPTNEAILPSPISVAEQDE